VTNREIGCLSSVSIFITNCDMLNLETGYFHQNWYRWMHTVAIILSVIFCVSKVTNDAGGESF